MGNKEILTGSKETIEFPTFRSYHQFLKETMENPKHLLYSPYPGARVESLPPLGITHELTVRNWVGLATKLVNLIDTIRGDGMMRR